MAKAKTELPAHLRNADYYELLTAYFVVKDELAGYMRKSSGIDWKVIRDKTDEGDALIYALRPAHKKHLKRAGRDAKDVPRTWVPGDAEKEWLEAERERRKAIAAGNAPTRYNRPTPTNGKRAAAADYSSKED